jgi:hypothetical protein
MCRNPIEFWREILWLDSHGQNSAVAADVPEYLTEYEIDFKFAVGTFYQTQLRLLNGPPNGSHDLSE